jgi:hypothetical protein
MLQKVLRVLTDTCLLVFVIHPKHNVLFIPNVLLNTLYEVSVFLNFFQNIFIYVKIIFEVNVAN